MQNYVISKNNAIPNIKLLTTIKYSTLIICKHFDKKERKVFNFPLSNIGL